MCSYCGSIHQPRQCLAYGKKCTDCYKISHFRRVCRSKRTRAVNEVEHETAQGSIEEGSIDSVNINSINFNKNHLVITANLKTSANKSSIIVPYKVDTGSDGNIIPLHIYKKLFPRVANEQLMAAKTINEQLTTYNRTTITQLGMCTVKIEYNEKQKMCQFL